MALTIKEKQEVKPMRERFRLLAPVKKQYQPKTRQKAKPRTLLKHQIPIRAYSEWAEKHLGFWEVALVSQQGGDSRRDFIQTLDAT